MKDPLAKLSEYCIAVNNRLLRDDLSESNIQVALKQVSYEPVRKVLLDRLSNGEAHYKEKYLFNEMMTTHSVEAGNRAGIVVNHNEGMAVSDPTAIRKLFTPNIPLSSISMSLQCICFLMTLHHWGVPLSVLGRWCYVRKSTVQRWMLGLALELWPIVSGWIQQQVKSRSVYVDEKWLKIKNKWYYWFVVLDVETNLPILTSLLASRGEMACRWIGSQLKELGQIPKWFITDGMTAYNYLKEELAQLHA